MIIDDFKVDDLLADFCAAKALSQLDQAILDHATDGWPMGRLARPHGTEPKALHRSEGELMSEFPDYLKDRGLCCSSDVFDE